MEAVYLILLVFHISNTYTQDPCQSYSVLYDDGSRSVQCDGYFKGAQDRFISEGWRRVRMEFTSEDLMMPTTCVPHGNCGSHSAIWLNGTHPTAEDDIVSRQGCLSTFSSCCHIEYPIQIKNCSSFMVYNLKRTSGSDERYCFGNSKGCPTTTPKTTAETTTTTTANKPTVPITNNDTDRDRIDPDDDYDEDDDNDKRHKNRTGNDMKTVTIVLSVVIVVLVLALICTLCFMKFFYRPRKRTDSVIKDVYGTHYTVNQPYDNPIYKN